MDQDYNPCCIHKGIVNDFAPMQKQSCSDFDDSFTELTFGNNAIGLIKSSIHNVLDKTHISHIQD